MDDQLPEELNRLAPEVDTAAARAVFERRRSVRRRRRWVGRGIAGVAVIALAGFGLAQLGDDEPTPLAVGGDEDRAPTSRVTATTTTAPVPSGERSHRTFDVGGVEVLVDTDLTALPEQASVVEFSMTVIDAGAGPELCVGGVAESLPPQCSGPVVDGLSLDGWSQEAGGVRWGDRTVAVSWPPVDGQVRLLSDGPYAPRSGSSPSRPAPGEDLLALQASIPATAYGLDELPYLVGSSASDRVELYVAAADLATVRRLVEIAGNPDRLRVVSFGAVLSAPPEPPPSTTTPSPTTTIPEPVTTTEPAPPPTVLPPPRLFVTQIQTACCYIEGSIGLMEILAADGARVGPITGAGEASGDVDSLHSSWDVVELPPGAYTVSVWQLPGIGPGPSREYTDWEASAAAGDQRPDLCTMTITLERGDLAELRAVWAPGQGCAFASS